MARMIASVMIVLLPIMLASGFVAMAFGLETGSTLRLICSLLIGGPAIIAYGVFAGALLAASGRGGLFGLLLSLPLLIPVAIFGEAAVTEGGPLLSSPPLHALFGLSLVAVVISAVASAAALGVNAE